MTQSYITDLVAKYWLRTQTTKKFSRITNTFSSL